MADDYGLDLSCTSDIDPAAADVSGVTCVSQAIYRRLITPRGGLIDDPAYGLDVTSYIDESMTTRQIAVLANAINSELRKDERVLRVVTQGSFRRDGASAGVYTATCDITLVTGVTFQLVLAISSVSVKILSVDL